jgi:hypothetical protein
VGLLKGLKTLVVEWHLCGTSLGQEDKMTDVLANPPTLTDDQFQAIEDELVSLAVHINRATYRMLCLIRELDICGAPQNAGFCSTAHYLSWRLGFDMVTFFTPTTTTTACWLSKPALHRRKGRAL